MGEAGEAGGGGERFLLLFSSNKLIPKMGRGEEGLTRVFIGKG